MTLPVLSPVLPPAGAVIVEVVPMVDDVGGTLALCGKENTVI